jgi:hypothetical protein
MFRASFEPRSSLVRASFEPRSSLVRASFEGRQRVFALVVAIRLRPGHLDSVPERTSLQHCQSQDVNDRETVRLLPAFFLGYEYIKIYFPLNICRDSWRVSDSFEFTLAFAPLRPVLHSLNFILKDLKVKYLLIVVKRDRALRAAAIASSTTRPVPS